MKMFVVDGMPYQLGFDPSLFESKTAERIIKGKHRPNWALHWRIQKAGTGLRAGWDVLEPLQLVGAFEPPPAEFDTFEEACGYVAGKVDEWMTAQPSEQYLREHFAIDGSAR